MATVKRTTTRIKFEATFDGTVLTNAGGGLLIDLTILAWDSKQDEFGFMYGAYHFKFSLPNEKVKAIRTKLLLGITVRITLPCSYEVW